MYFHTFRVCYDYTTEHIEVSPQSHRDSIVISDERITKKPLSKYDPRMFAWLGRRLKVILSDGPVGFTIYESEYIESIR